MRVGIGVGWVGLGLLVCAQAAGGQKPAAGEPSLTFVLKLDGGVAYVFSDADGRVDVGPIAPPAGARAANFNAHPMFLKIKSGKAQKHPRWPLPPTSGGPDTWALAGFEVWPCPDGVCPTASALAVSPDEGPHPSRPCNPPRRDVSDLGFAAADNLYYLPNLLDLHPSTDLPADWHGRLQGRVVLKAGRLVVVETFNCVELKKGGVSRRQAFTSGDAGVHYVVPARKHVDLLFKELASGTITGAVRLVPGGDAEITTHLLMLGPGRKHTLTVGQSLPEFQQFYELLPAVPSGDRFDAKFEPEAQPDFSPGQECGSVRFRGPSPAPPAPRP